MSLAFTWDETYGEELVAFVQKSVQTRSYSDEEGDFARLIEGKMKEWTEYQTRVSSWEIEKYLVIY